MPDDATLLLLSWAQVAQALLLDDSERFKKPLGQLEQRLQRDFNISDIKLTSRTPDHYTVTYLEEGNRRVCAFAAKDVDDFV